ERGNGGLGEDRRLRLCHDQPMLHYRRVKIRELGHISLYVRDLEATRRFYRDVLGLTETGTGKNGRIVFFSAGVHHHDVSGELARHVVVMDTGASSSSPPVSITTTCRASSPAPRDLGRSRRASPASITSRSTSGPR